MSKLDQLIEIMYHDIEAMLQKNITYCDIIYFENQLINYIKILKKISFDFKPKYLTELNKLIWLVNSLVYNFNERA